jgi:hypothetical protein
MQWNMRSLVVALLMFAAGYSVSGCVDAAQVVQGTVVRYEPDAKILVMQNDRQPGAELTLNLREAEIGADPVAGDTVRVAYHDRSGELVAGRVMNISRQKELASEKPK